MLYLPMVVGLFAIQDPPPGRAVLLGACATAFFLAEAATRVSRRGSPGWVWTYSLLGAGAGGALLLASPAPGSQVALGCLAGSALLLQRALRPLARRRRDTRLPWDGIAGVAGLAVTAPAAAVTASGSLRPEAWLLWALCAAYFAGGVLHVEMFVRAARLRKAGEVSPAEIRRRAAAGTLRFHLGLAAALCVWTLVAGEPGVRLQSLAFAPAVGRSLWDASRLGRGAPPPFRRIGQRELAHAIVFAGALIAAGRA